MSEAIVFITHHRIKDGKLDGFREHYSEGTKSLQTEKPQTVVFLGYLNEGGTEATFVHIFPDADSMDLHMQGVEERAGAAYEFLEPQRFEIYGTPSDGVLDGMRQAAAASGAELGVRPESLGGFTRLASMTPGDDSVS